MTTSAVPAPLPRFAHPTGTAPRLGAGWLVALSSLPFLLLAPVFAFVWTLAPVDAQRGSIELWASLALATSVLCGALAVVGLLGDRRALAGQSWVPSRWWFAPMALAAPLAAPAYLLTRGVRCGSGWWGLLAWALSWSWVALATVVAGGAGWMAESGWSAEDLEDDLLHSLYDTTWEDEDGKETLSDTVTITCPDDAWYVVNTTVTCTMTDGQRDLLIDVDLVDYYEREFTLRPTKP